MITSNSTPSSTHNPVLENLRQAPTNNDSANENVPLLLTAPEAAKLLRISPRTLWTLTKEGHMPAVRLGRIVRYDVQDLIAWIHSRKTHGPARPAA